MDHLGKEIAAIGAIACAEPQNKDFDHHRREQEACDGFESRAFCVSTSSELPENSSHASFGKLEVSDKGLVSLDNAETLRTDSDVANDEEPEIKGLVLGNFKILSQGQTGHRRHFYQLSSGSRDRTSHPESNFHNEDGVLFNSRGKKKMKLIDHLELMPLSRQESEGLNQGQADTAEADGCNRPTSSYRQSLGENQLKIPSSSSFTNVFSKHYFQGKGVKSKDLESEYEFCSTTANAINPQLPMLNRKPSDAPETPKSVEGQHSSQIAYCDGSISSQNKINFRQWLNSGVSEIIKVERLKLFRHIVQLVDIAHSEGIGLQDLRPSNFIFESPNSIKYTGSFSAPSELLSLFSQVITEKMPLQQDMQKQSTSGVKWQNLGKDVIVTTDQAKYLSACGIIRADTCKISIQDDDYTKCMALSHPINESVSILTNSCIDPDIVQLEKKWYVCPGEHVGRDLLSENIYSLGVLLFELLCCFATSDKHSAAMWDLRNRILPAKFLSQNPKEAGFCFWLLHPEPSARPTTREILQSEIICSPEEVHSGHAIPSYLEEDEDTDSELLLHFLVSLEEEKKNQASTLLGGIECLEADIKEVGKKCTKKISSNRMDKELTHARWDVILKQNADINAPQETFSITDEENLVKSISQLEETYFSIRSDLKLRGVASLDRSDKDILSHRDKYQSVNGSKVEGRPVDRLGAFFEGVCKFVRYSKFEVCGGLQNGNLLNSTNVICSLSFDRDEDYIAAAGVSRKIKIFEFSSLLSDSVDGQYSVVEMTNKSKLSCVCWNHYIKSFLASADYDGVVQLWDANTCQAFAYYNEHEDSAWSVDFSLIDPARFASGSDDCLVKLWNITERNSVGTIWSPANVCCVQFSAYSSHLLAFGSADYRIYCYDLRHTRIPWCTLAGHGKAVSYVKFLDPETLVSASTDNALKLWDLKKTSFDGLSSDACSLTFTGHTNKKNFVGLSVLDGYIACGSETNEVYVYHRSLPIPIISHKFGSIDPISGNEIYDGNGQFVSSVCWRTKSNIVVSANSSGNIRLLCMA